MRVAGAIYLAVAVAFAALVAAVGLGARSDDRSDRLLWFAFIGNGALICLALAREMLVVARRKLWRRELAHEAGPALYLLLWVMGTSAFYVLFAPFIATRHVLLILPAVTLLLLVQWGTSLTRASKAFGLALTVVVSAGLCLSEWRFATFYRLEAAMLGRSLPTSGTVWARATGPGSGMRRKTGFAR